MMQIMVAASPAPEHPEAAAAVEVLPAVVTIAALHYWKWIKPSVVAAARHGSGCLFPVQLALCSTVSRLL